MGPVVHNRAMLAGKISLCLNAISITREAENKNLPIARDIWLTQALQGPVRRIALEHVMDCYVIWKFAENIAGAKKFLVDYIDNFRQGFLGSEFYNFPCFPSTVPDLQKLIADDQKATPRDKYKVLGALMNQATNVGYPGYANAAVDEIFNTWVLNTMFAKQPRATRRRRTRSGLPMPRASAFSPSGATRAWCSARQDMASVEVRSLSKHFDGANAVDNVDLGARDAEFLVLLGPSGSGKTTLLRLIAGLEAPSRGDILVDGRVVTALPPRLRNMAMVFQSYALYPHLNVFDNIAFPLRARHMSREEVGRKVDWAAQLFGIGPLLQRKPRQLSGGERQRVALARGGARAGGVPARRALVQSGRQAADLGARRAATVPAPAGHHYHLRDA